MTTRVRAIVRRVLLSEYWTICAYPTSRRNREQQRSAVEIQSLIMYETLTVQAVLLTTCREDSNRIKVTRTSKETASCKAHNLSFRQAVW